MDAPTIISITITTIIIMQPLIAIITNKIEKKPRMSKRNAIVETGQ